MAVAMYLRKSRADREAEARGEGETLAGFSCAVTRSDERGTFTAGSARRGASSVRPLLHSSLGTSAPLTVVILG